MHDDKKLLLIEAAIEVLQTENFGTMKTASVAAEAGVSEGTIYRYFRSKKDLYIEVLKYVGELLKKYFLSAVSPEKTLIENFVTLANLFYERDKMIDRFYRVLYKASAEIDDEDMKSEMIRIFQDGQDAFKEMFAGGLDSRNMIIEPFQIDIAFMMIWGFADMLWRQVAIYKKETFGKEQLSSVIRVFQSLLNPTDNEKHI